MMRLPLSEVDPVLYQAIEKEKDRLNSTLELIASENFVSRAVLEAAGCIMTNKYAEGYPSKRYYGGCEFVDIAEEQARERAKKLFKAHYVNVQPHSGSQANMAAYFALKKPGAKLLGMNLAHGGHLTHGSPVNFSGRLFHVATYGVDKQTGMIDYEEVRKIARQEKPDIIIVGFSAYPRKIDFKKFREIADEVGAYIVTDIAHVAGLVATGNYPDPVPFSDIVTTTTHKTLRGPRGGMILMAEKYAEKDVPDPVTEKPRSLARGIDSQVFPGIQGGPLMHIIAAKAVAFLEALQPEFKTYCGQIIKNAGTLAGALTGLGYQLVSGGTDNHLMLVDLTNKNLTGKDAEHALEMAGITVNKNMVPFDRQKAAVTSGIRIGTPAVTTRGFREAEIRLVGELIDRALMNRDNDAVLGEVRKKVKELCHGFPLYDFLKEPQIA